MLFYCAYECCIFDNIFRKFYSRLTPVKTGGFKPSSNYTGGETAANLNSMNAKTVTVKAKWTLINYVKDFDYTGSEQTWTAPYTGYYKVELWGASGGSYDAVYHGGYGGYVRGDAHITKNASLYVYVGGTGHCYKDVANESGGWNGGGAMAPSPLTYFDPGSCSGGGTTDIRTASGMWDNETSLRSRVIVAGGGGGSAYQDTTWYANGGSSGGLTGNIRTVYSNNATTYYGGAGTQVSGGAAGKIYGTHAAPQSGGFGYGGDGNSPDEPSGGGSGWYGGGGTNTDGGGGGGSSYISGHTGCVAVTSTNSSSPKSGCTTGTTTNSCSVSPYNYTFNSTTMIDGIGYSWTNIKGALQQMPNPSGGYYASGVGHSGNGYARITYLGTSI